MAVGVAVVLRDGAAERGGRHRGRASPLSTPSSPSAWAPPVAPKRRVSGAWWLLPILMGWVGGLIAWLVNKDADPKVARSMLITGIAISVVVIILFVSAPPSTP